LLQIGIDKNKIKAALRMSPNKEEALLIATDESVNWENKDYLFYDNEDVYSNSEFNQLCIKEIKKEIPKLEDEDEILKIIKNVVDLIKKNKLNIKNNGEEINENESNESVEEEEENESSSSDDIPESDSNNGDVHFEFI